MCVYSVLLYVFHCIYSFELSLLPLTLPPPPHPTHTHTYITHALTYILTHSLTHTNTQGVITFLVPCYTAGKNAEAAGEGCVAHGVYSLIPILNIYCHALIRGKIRDQKQIDV